MLIFQQLMTIQILDALINDGQFRERTSDFSLEFIQLCLLTTIYNINCNHSVAKAELIQKPTSAKLILLSIYQN